MAEMPARGRLPVMDWSSLGRLIPEAIILIVAGYFTLKGIGIFQSIVNKIDEQHHNALSKLADSIDKNTESNNVLIKVGMEQKKASHEVLTFMKNLNGKVAKITKQAMDERNRDV